MLEQIFTGLGRAIEGSPAAALSAAFAWGVLSILLSPCHLAGIPLIVGFIGGQGAITTGRAFRVALAFAVGILLTLALIGFLTREAGRLMGDTGPWGARLVAVFLFAAGLNLLGWLPLPFSGPGRIGLERKGVLAALVLGLVFGIALGPCTFAFMAPVLGLMLVLAPTQPVFGVLLLACYALGHCAVLVLAGTFAEAVQRYLNWNARSRGAVILRKACGALVILGGAYLLAAAR